MLDFFQQTKPYPRVFQRDFTPNFTAPKHKNKKKHFDIFSPQATILKQIQEKPICQHLIEIDEEEGYYYCTLCFDIVDQVFITDDKDEKVKQQHQVIWSRDYDRNRWKNYGIEYILGQNNSKITDQVWLDVLRSVPKEFTWYDIYKTFQTNNLLEYWTAFSSMAELPIPLTPEILEKVDKYLNLCNTKYRVTYLYLMYKFVQLQQGEEQAKYIPLARSKAWCKKTDVWWKEICIKEGIEFYPTKCHSLKWNKEKICSNLFQHLKKNGHLKTVKEYSKTEWEQKFNLSFSEDHNGDLLQH